MAIETRMRLILRNVFSGVFFFLIVQYQAISQHLTNPLTSLHDSKEFIIGIDNRITKINHQWGVIYGLYSGVGYGENLRFKFSLSGTPFTIGEISHEDSSSQESRVLFASFGQEFDFFTVGRIKLIAYVNAGFGYHFFKTFDAHREIVIKDNEPMLPLELGLHGRYQINTLIAFKTGGGWRFVGPSSANELSGFYIKLTLVVNPKNMKAYFNKRKEKKSEENR
jgi:hypothetical protein